VFTANVGLYHVTKKKLLLLVVDFVMHPTVSHSLPPGDVPLLANSTIRAKIASFGGL